MLSKVKKFRNYYANSVDAFIPELWSRESLAILEENMTASGQVFRDFKTDVAAFGETVHTRKPGELEAVRKVNGDTVTVQDVSATDVEVKLNQHVHTSFLIKDGEESKSFMELVSIYLRPAMLAQARFLDQIVLGQYPQFINNCKGNLGSMTSSNARDYILDVREKMNTNKAYSSGRNMIVGPVTETTLLKMDLFTNADKVGDDGTALREASLGRKLGFDFFMCQNMASISTGNTVVTGAVNNASGYSIGATAITVDGLSAAISNGTYVTIAGDDTPQRVASTTGGSTPTVITLASPGLRKAVVDNAVVKIYTPGAVNLGAGYAAGWAKAITVDGFTVAPRTGQIVAFGDSSATAVYTIIGTPTTTSILLDRPLDAAIADDAKVNIGPPGDYNLAFHRNAIALVVRPLALPMPGAGAKAGLANYNGLSMRTVITYDGSQQGHLVTLDMLCGVKVLETALGAVLLG